MQYLGERHANNYPKMNRWKSPNKTINSKIKDSTTGLECALDDAFVDYTAQSAVPVMTIPLKTPLFLHSVAETAKITFNSRDGGALHTLTVGTETFEVVRHSRKRLIEIEIFHGKKGTDVEDNTVIVWDNAGGMSPHELFGLMDLGRPREARGYKDKRPDGQNTSQTRGLECHIGQYGLGVKTAAFQMGEGDKRGFLVRTKDKESQWVTEQTLTSKLIDEGESQTPPVPWTECSVKRPSLTPGSAKDSLIPDELKRHKRIQQLLDQETECVDAGVGFTWVICTGVIPPSPLPLHSMPPIEGKCTVASDALLTLIIACIFMSIPQDWLHVMGWLANMS